MVRAGISVIWNVLSWSGGHEFKLRLGSIGSNLGCEVLLSKSYLIPHKISSWHFRVHHSGIFSVLNFCFSLCWSMSAFMTSGRFQIIHCPSVHSMKVTSTRILYCMLSLRLLNLARGLCSWSAVALLIWYIFHLEFTLQLKNDCHYTWRKFQKFSPWTYHAAQKMIVIWYTNFWSYFYCRIYGIDKRNGKTSGSLASRRYIFSHWGRWGRLSLSMLCPFYAQSALHVRVNSTNTISLQYYQNVYTIQTVTTVPMSTAQHS